MVSFNTKMVLIVRRPIRIIDRYYCQMKNKFVNPKTLFGNKVRQLRMQRGLSQEKFAFECNVDRTYIGGVERGERNISLINIIKIAKALNIHPKELFETDDDKNVWF